MSREQDPNMHTYAVVANRVLCADGRWRTVDGRAVYAASVGARAVYEQALEAELARRGPSLSGEAPPSRNHPCGRRSRRAIRLRGGAPPQSADGRGCLRRAAPQ
jgi:TrwC relaxase